jgi:signal transduction histidine kinase
MLADALEGMRGRLVDELARRLALVDPPSPLPAARRARLNRDVGQVIEVLRHGGSNSSPASSVIDDPKRELDEHELVEAFLLEQAAKNGQRTRATERAIAHWRCAADRRCLREQNRRLEQLLDEVNEGAAVLAPDGRFLYGNRRAVEHLRELAGVRRRDIIGKRPDELGLSLEHLIGRPVADVATLGRTRASFQLQAAGRANESQFDAVYEPDGTVGAVALVVRDTFDRRQAQVRLDILSKLGALVGVLDYDEVAAGIAGVPVPELADWCALNVVENEHIQRTYLVNRDPSKTLLRDALLKAKPNWLRHPLWQQMLTSGCQLLTEVSDDLLRKVAGNDVRYGMLAALGIQSVMVIPLVTRSQVTGILSLVYTRESGRRFGGEDVALAKEIALHAGHALENARLLKELKAGEERFRVALAGARTVVFEQDMSLQYTWYYNPLARDGNVDSSPDFPSDEAAVLTALKKRVIERGESVTEELDLTLDSSVRHYREAIEPTRDHTGKVVGIIGAATDITEQQTMKEQLTDDVRFRERIMGVLSHDLRNPLNAITMSTDLLLRRGERPPESREHIARIRRAADRMQEMIETLLDFTRLRFGAFPLSFGPADLGSIAVGIVDEMRSGRPDRQIDLRVQGAPRGNWDAARVSQAVGNLVANALAYGCPGAPVTVDVAGNDREATLSVNNRGDPIPASFLGVIFEPFRRAVRDRDRSPHGLGLGLYIVQQIVLAHGGDVQVESNAERGTTFTMRLPRG